MSTVIWSLLWFAGIIIAKGFWSTFFAVCTFGLWSLYLVVERVISVYWPALL